MEFNMETENESPSKRSFALNMKIYDLLQIASNCKNIILWNKYQMFLFETTDFCNEPILLEPSFKVLNIVFDDKYLVCLDYSNNLHILMIKHINIGKGRKVSIPFKPIAQNVLSLLQLEHNELLTLQNNFGQYSLNLHNPADFQRYVEIFILKYLEENIQITENIIFKSYSISNLNKQCLDMIFNINEKYIFDGMLIIMVLDQRTLYGCILHTKKDNIDKDISIKKLYYSSLDICNINITEIEYDINIIIALKSGTVIKLPFGNNLVPEIIHLNTQINKLIAIKDTFIYVNDLSMWKATNTFTKQISFQELFVKNTKDFVIEKDIIISVNFSNIVYVFLIENNTQVNVENEYQPVNTVVESIELLFKEIKKNDELVKKIEIERNFTTAIALANRQDIMNALIQHTVTVFDSYKEVVKENSEITLTSDLQEYFIPNTFLILTKILFKSDYNNGIRNIYISLIDLLKLHITITNKSSILKTISISIKDLDKCSFLIPLNCEETTEFDINLKLICPIGYLYKNEPNWIILFQRNVKLTSESFIKTTTDDTLNIYQLRQNKVDFPTLLMETAKNYNKTMNFQKECIKFNEIAYYIKLPSEYENIFSNKNCYLNINNNKAEYLFKKLSRNEFLKRNHVVQINVREFKIKLCIYKEDTEFILKLTGDNALTVFHMKNYFDQILFGEIVKQFIDQAEYTKIEDLRRKLINHQCSRDPSGDTIMHISDDFNKNILGNLI